MRSEKIDGLFGVCAQVEEFGGFLMRLDAESFQNCFWFAVVGSVRSVNKNPIALPNGEFASAAVMNDGFSDGRGEFLRTKRRQNIVRIFGGIRRKIVIDDGGNGGH